MKVGFISLGCSKNLVDSEKMMGMLSKGNHTLVNDPKLAEAIIINTCGFINSAKEEGINTILEMAKYKKEGCKKLIVVGCLAQRYKDELKKEMPEVDAIISIREYDRLHELLGEQLEDDSLVVYSKAERLISSKPWTAYVKIAEGCSNRCTFCAIPLIRGGNVSRTIESIVAEAHELASRGVKELVLIAQDTTKYGEDLYQKRSLLTLLQEIHKIEGFHWIRILYMYPDEIDEELIVGMSKLPKVLPYFDIPMQHADDEMLVRMNRRGKVEEVKQTVEMIRKYHPDATLRTTFIVGFPQESEEAYQRILTFMKDVKWDRLGAFTYSPEEDTIAYKMDDAIDEEVKEERLQKLMELQESIAYENNKKNIGKIVEVLVESQEGLTGKYRGRGISSAPDEVDGIVIFKSPRFIEFGTFVKVKITQVLPHDLIGEEWTDEKL